MAPPGDGKLAKIGEVFSQVNSYYTVRCHAQGPVMSAVGTANLPAAMGTAQHYRSDQPAATKLPEMSAEEAAHKLGGLAIADRGVGRSSSGLGFAFRARHEKTHRV
ncbi:unnamed protein product [Linum trigynum]|uniref:AT-hook motif nuclear-localized protein n=1 Tax=Linum trigynum TaxID=586398 RepID=A0AAV2GQX0_9ROSI